MLKNNHYGYTVSKKIKQNYVFSDLPIISVDSMNLQKFDRNFKPKVKMQNR